MPGAVLSDSSAKLPRYQPPEATKVSLDYADLPIIDLSKAGTTAERLHLASQTCDALKSHGFFYVVNHGYSPAQTQRIFDIANLPFEHTAPDEKKKFAGNMKESGSFQGYKLRQYWHIEGGIHDQNETYNINRDVTKRQHPVAIQPYLNEISDFAHHTHTNVLHPILRLLALSLELQEDTLVNMHQFDAVGETYVRFMKYYPRSADEEVKTNNMWLKGHTDTGSITVLYSQPVSGLQILTSDGIWKWVKHIENALVINAGDALEFLSGGFFKATIHRVVQPPADQQGYARLGVFYFCMTDDDIPLVPLRHSPVLRKQGIHSRFDNADAPTMEQWRKGRTSAYGTSDLKPGSKPGVEEELIAGILVQHYK